MNEAILNLTMHPVTSEQTQAGVHEPVFKSQVQNLLNFIEIPTYAGMKSRAQKLAHMCKEDGYTKAMIGGAPFFMSVLEQELKLKGIIPVYSFNVRNSKEVEQEDGTIKKVSIYKHSGFYEVL